MQGTEREGQAGEARPHPPRRGEDAEGPGLEAASPWRKASLRGRRRRLALRLRRAPSRGFVDSAGEGLAAGGRHWSLFQHWPCHLVTYLKHRQIFVLKPFEDLISHHMGLVANFLPGSWLARPSPSSPCRAFCLRSGHLHRVPLQHTHVLSRSPGDKGRRGGILR